MNTQVVEGFMKYGVALGLMGLAAGVVGIAQEKLNITLSAENSLYMGVAAVVKPGVIAVVLSVAVIGLAVFVAKYIVNKAVDKRAKGDSFNIACKIELPTEKENGQDKSLLPADIKKPSESNSNPIVSMAAHGEILATLALAQKNLTCLIKQYPAPDQWRELLIEINAKISSLYDKKGLITAEKIDVTQINSLLGSVKREVMLWKLDRLIGKRTLDRESVEQLATYRKDLYAITLLYLLVENKHYIKICAEIEKLFVSNENGLCSLEVTQKT